MAYRTGFCPQCDTEIMVQDVDGKWNSFKSNWAQGYLVFSDGHRCLTTICKDCLSAPDFSKIMGSILHIDSEACGETTKEFLRYTVKPKELTEGQFVAFGKLYQDAQGKDVDATKSITMGGKTYEDFGEFQPLEKTYRGLPISIQPWSLKGS